MTAFRLDLVQNLERRESERDPRALDDSHRVRSSRSHLLGFERPFPEERVRIETGVLGQRRERVANGVEEVAVHWVTARWAKARSGHGCDPCDGSRRLGAPFGRTTRAATDKQCPTSARGRVGETKRSCAGCREPTAERVPVPS
jgi:hypothetical protein